MKVFLIEMWNVKNVIYVQMYERGYEVITLKNCITVFSQKYETENSYVMVSKNCVDFTSLGKGTNPIIIAEYY